MTSDLDDILQRVFDGVWDRMTDEEQEVARKVASWYENFGKVGTLTAYEQDVVNAVWASARDELGSERANLIPTFRRFRDVNDVRACMYRITHELLPTVPKSQLGKVLGIDRDHATLLYSLNRCGDLIQVDPAFRALYFRLYRHTMTMLEEEDE